MLYDEDDVTYSFAFVRSGFKYDGNVASRKANFLLSTECLARRRKDADNV
jgi:hypothetical protein